MFKPSFKPPAQQTGDMPQGRVAPGSTVAPPDTGGPAQVDPVVAANMMHQSAADGVPDGSGNVPVHPGCPGCRPVAPSFR